MAGVVIILTSRALGRVSGMNVARRISSHRVITMVAVTVSYLIG